jgi:hypothetical protein
MFSIMFSIMFSTIFRSFFDHFFDHFFRPTFSISHFHLHLLIQILPRCSIHPCRNTFLFVPLLITEGRARMAENSFDLKY